MVDHSWIVEERFAKEVEALFVGISLLKSVELADGEVVHYQNQL